MTVIINRAEAIVNFARLEYETVFLGMRNYFRKNFIVIHPVKIGEIAKGKDEISGLVFLRWKMELSRLLFHPQSKIKAVYLNRYIFPYPWSK